MGIQDLVSWAKKAHPSALQSFPKRWAAPEIRNKRIAIDATLLTNRFHFAMTDGPLKGKGGLLGWYSLINVMRAHGIQPVAIWDKPGKRKWKEPETRKRTLTRANNIARRAHELDRADRLGALRAAFRELDSLPFEEQEVVRQHWATTRFVSPEGATEVTESTVRKAAERIVVPPLVDERVGVTEGSDQGVASGQGVQTVPKPEPATYTTQTSHASHTIGLSVGRTIVRVLRSIDVLTALVARYRASNVTREWGVPESPEVSQAIEYVRELEDLTEQVEAESSTTGRAVTEAGEAHEREEGAVSARAAREFVDERIEEVMPETVAESRRQNALTMEEGEIIDAFLTPRPGPEVGEEQTQARTSPAESALPDKVLVEDDILEVWTPPTDTPLHRLDDLISRLPDVLATYDRPLNIPSQRDHADCRELLVKMGVPVIEAEPPFEAEGVASALANRGLVDYVGTEDSDVIAYDGPLLKNLTTAKEPLVLLRGSALRAASSLSPEAFLDFCILLGTDASPRIPKLGPVSAFKAMQKHGSIEAMLASDPTIAERAQTMQGGVDGWMELVRNAREVFRSVPPIPDGLELGQGKWDEEEVERWLEVRHGISFVDPEGAEQGRVEEMRAAEEWDEIIASENEGIGR